MKYKLVVLFFSIIFQVKAQKVYRFESSLLVTKEDKTLLMPFAGGINSPQIQQIDLNGDGQEELVIWDKNAANLLVFEKVEDHYHHRPHLSYHFPKDIQGFLVLADFDGDGKKDLFTGSPFGIKVYKNITVGNLPQWELEQEFLRLDNQANLQMNSLDVPAIMDLDGDGDLDIVTFNFAAGDFLEFFKNTSIERKGSPDLDGFASAIMRWGGFEFCGCDHFSFGQACDGRPINRSPKAENLKIEHTGGHSVLLHDFNGDGMLDLLMGQDECNSLYYLLNEGSNSAPVFNSYQKAIPQLGALPEFPIFHAAYKVDEGLVITTNSSASASTYNINYAQSIYHYDQDRQLTTRGFLQEDMVDLGENSRPYFKGKRNSGELIVTANSLKDNEVVGSAYHFTLSSEGLRLDDTDFRQLSTLGLLDLQYQEILSAGNARSLLVSGVEVINFAPVRELYWFPSLDAQTPQMIHLPEVQLRGNDHCEFFRYEGEDYLLVARQTGELLRYGLDLKNQPEAVLLDRNYLDFTDNAANRNLSVHVVERGKHLDLYAVDQKGELKYIPDFLHNRNRSPIWIQLEDESLAKSRFGRNTWITSLPSEFDKRNDLILGNTSGGLIYLEDVSTDIALPDEVAVQIVVYPNPTSGPLRILASSEGTISLINTLGQVIIADTLIKKEIPLQLDVYSLSNGVYFIQMIASSGERVTKKLIVKKT